MKTLDLAIVGENMADEILTAITKRGYPFSPMIFTENALDFAGKFDKVLSLSGESIIKNRADICLMCGSAAAAKRFTPLFTALSCSVVDCTGAFSGDENVPLCMPFINPTSALFGDGVVALPSVEAMTAAAALFPLHKKLGVVRCCLTVLSPVKHDGGEVLSIIGESKSSGYTTAELTLVNQLREIIGSQQLAVTASILGAPNAVRLGICCNVELACSVSPEGIERLLSGLVLESDEQKCSSDIHLSRVRRDFSRPNSFNFFLSVHPSCRIAHALLSTAELLI